MTAHLQNRPMTIDPLIKEAKRRMRLRRAILLTAALAGVVLVVAFLLALQPGSHSGWVSQGVAEIDIRGGGVSQRVIDPSQVSQMVAWFNDLKRNTKLSPLHNGQHYLCAGGYALNVTFTFRSASGAELATANSAPLRAASYCSPVLLNRAGQPQTYLVDRNSANGFVGRVGRLVGVKFRGLVYNG